MPQALPASPLHLHQCLDGLASVTHRLSVELDVTITHSALPNGRLGDWHSGTRTMQIAEGATFTDEVWLLVQLWLLLSIGPAASAAAHPAPLLQLVPDPRRPLDASVN